MATKNRKTKHALIPDSAERTAERMAHLRSGAAGSHADSNARKNAPGLGRTNRVGSRSSRRRAAISDY